MFIDLDLEKDHGIVYGKNFITICGMHMKLQKWTANFKPEEETTLSLVWINLPELPWHFIEWDALCCILAPVGTPIFRDKATLTKSRPTMSKVKVEMQFLDSSVIHLSIVYAKCKALLWKDF